MVRKLAAAVVGSVLIFSTAGCSFSPEVASLAEYAPSDGNQTDAGSLHARNVLILSDGKSAFIIGSITNDSEKPAEATIGVLEGAVATPVDFRVNGLSKVDFGYPEALGFAGSQPGIKLEGVLPAIGSNVEVKLDGSVGGTTTIGSGTMAVQVIDANLPTYSGFLADLAQPEPTATATVTPEPTPTPVAGD